MAHYDRSHGSSSPINNLVHNQLTFEQNMRIMDDDYFHFDNEWTSHFLREVATTSFGIC